MSELPLGGVEIAADVGQIASGSGTVEQRAEGLLEPLRRLVPFQGAVIHLLDPDRGTQVPALSRGYGEAVNEFFSSPALTEEIELWGFTRNRAALRMCDLPCPPEQVRGWAEHLRPAGFREGLAVSLFTRDNRHLGVLSLHTDTNKHPTAAARDLICVLAPVIANAVDPLRSITTMAKIVADAYAGIVLTRALNTLPLPGLPDHRLLHVGSDVLAVAAKRVSTHGGYGSFLCPDPAHDAPGGCTRITVLASPPDAPHCLAGMVLVSPPGNLHGLTRRELEVLGLIVEGWPNHRIAAALAIAQRTANTHLEHILAKLRVPTRTVAAVRALRLGLYVPRPLNGIRE
jgi:DNA-binding CsgD family transcriptional regulator